jgi:hypothetical protein
MMGIAQRMSNSRVLEVGLPMVVNGSASQVGQDADRRHRV